MLKTNSNLNLKIEPSAVKPGRLWEIDALRGIAIILVVFYHLVWDLAYFQLYPINPLTPAWQTFARGIGSSFIFLLGLSLSLSYAQTIQRKGRLAPFRKYLSRGGKIFGLGVMISVVTYIVIGPGFVVFGILHLLGLGIILAYPFLSQNKWISLVMGLLLIGLGVYLNAWSVSYPWLIWLGIPQQGRAMVDYYPLLPWFGLILLGLFSGRLLYPQGVSRLPIPDLATLAPVAGLVFLGKRTLMIYLIHQPILIGFLLVIKPYFLE